MTFTFRSSILLTPQNINYSRLLILHRRLYLSNTCCAFSVPNDEANVLDEDFDAAMRTLQLFSDAKVPFAYSTGLGGLKGLNKHV
jgi:hypothetical protein